MKENTYYSRHQEEMKAKAREYYQKHKTRVKAKAKTRYKMKPSVMSRKRQRKYHSDDEWAEGVREYNRERQRAIRAKKSTENENNITWHSEDVHTGAK